MLRVGREHDKAEIRRAASFLGDPQMTGGHTLEGSSTRLK